MCGESMRRLDRLATVQIPGTTQVRQYAVAEWVCRECDYFEEVGTREEDDSPER